MLWCTNALGKLLFLIVPLICFQGLGAGQVVPSSTPQVVFRELLSGIGSDEPLELKVNTTNVGGPAYYSDRTIYVHQGLMEVLSGERIEDALSYVLAHEFAHHERNHLCSHFAQKVSAATAWAEERSTKEQTIANSKRIETEADTYAGLYGHIAGFRPLDVAVETLDRIYEAYDIPDSLPGYPTLEERKSMVEKAREEFNDVAQAYDAAWIALATGEYAAATYLLSTIIIDAEYASPEMHGLLALVQFLDVINSLNNPKLSEWSWPIRMQRDTNSRTREMSRSEKQTLVNQLAIALRYAQSANRLNVGKDALSFEELGREETGLEASITWLKKWILLDGQHDRNKRLLEMIETNKEGSAGVKWNTEIAVNLEALTWWMAEKEKKALKRLSFNATEANRLNALLINSVRGDGKGTKLSDCDQVQRLELETISSLNFGSNNTYERITVGGQRVLTRQALGAGAVNLELKLGKSELNFVILEPEALENFCWGLRPNLTLEELKTVFENQRKTVIEMNLGSILCLPEEHLAFQFNSKGQMSFAAISIN
jgi:hypothetical protein